MTDDSAPKTPLRQRLQALLQRDAAADPATSTAEAQELVAVLISQLNELDTRDAAERRRLTDRVLRLGQLYSTLSKVNQAVIHFRNRQQLFEEICRVAVIDGTFSMAWIGWVEETSGSVVLQASAGDTTGYFRLTPPTIRDEPRGHGPVGTSLREDRSVVVNNVQEDPMMAPWRDEALALGSRSVASLPLHLAGRPVGVIGFHSQEAGFFTDERVHLLKELSQTISFALDKMQAEAEIENLSRQRQLALDAARLGWIHYDPKTQLTSWDDRCQEIFAATDEQRRDGRVVAFLHPDDVPHALADFDAAVDPRHPKPFRAEYRLPRPDGVPRWISIHGQATFEGEGPDRHATSFIGAIADITERKLAEQALRDSEEKYRRLFDTESDAILVYDVDSERIADVNESCVRLFGYSREELLAMPYLNLSEEPEATNRTADELLTSKHIIVPLRYYRKKDGARFPVEVTANLFLLGARRFFCCVIRDITERLASDQALRDSEEKYRQLFATETDALVMFDARTYQMLEVNESTLRLYGYTREEFLALTCWDLTAEPDETKKSNDRLLTRGFDQVPLRYHRKKDGTVFPMEFSAVSFQLGDRTVFSVAVRDITQRLRAEQTLRDSEEKYRQIFATERDAILISDGTTQKYVDANDSALRLFGYSREELAQLWYRDLAADQEQNVDAVWDQLKSGPFGYTPLRYFKRKDGSVFPGEVSAGTFMLGNRQMFCATVRDITERLRAEQALRESEEKYRLFFETETDAIIIHDTETEMMIDGNPSALSLYGYSLEEFRALSVWALTTDPEGMRQTFANLKAQGVYHAPLRYHRRKDGTVFPVEISGSRFLLEGRMVYCGIMRDITERLRAEQEAEEYRKRLQALTMDLALTEERERKDLAAALHDDLVQMLALIRIRLALYDQLEQQDQRRDALAEVRRLIDLANSSARSIMLHLSHPILYERGLVPAVEWLAEDMRQMHHLAVSLQISPGIDPLDLKTRVVLFRCLRELLVNVAKHSGADRADLELVRTEDHVRATVADLGAGFDPETLHVRTDGGGFGLFAIKERLTMLGGRMTIDSAPGLGAIVTLEVPAVSSSPLSLEGRG